MKKNPVVAILAALGTKCGQDVNVPSLKARLSILTPPVAILTEFWNTQAQILFFHSWMYSRNWECEAAYFMYFMVM